MQENTAQDNAGHLRVMIEWCRAVQGRVKMERFRQERPVEGRTKTNRTGQIRQMCCTAQNIAKHNDPSKRFRLYRALQ